MICSGAGDVDDDAAAVAHLLYNYYYMLVALPTFCVSGSFEALLATQHRYTTNLSFNVSIYG